MPKYVNKMEENSFPTKFKVKVTHLRKIKSQKKHFKVK